MNKELLADTNFPHYRVVRKLGAGGMGEVYLAEDSRLDRKVALKVLLSEFVANEDRLRRFILEAKAAAALSHPNIAHIYEVGEADGAHYIAMEFVDGDTLTAKMQVFQDGGPNRGSGLRFAIRDSLTPLDGINEANRRIARLTPDTPG